MTRPGDRKVLAISQEELIQRLKKVRGIQDENVLDAIRQVPREEFVPEDLIKYAYEDTALPIGEGQVITQPYLVALMTEVLEMTEGDRVLEIGTGSGYAAAVISRIAEEVYTVERLPGLARAAGERFTVLATTTSMSGSQMAPLAGPNMLLMTPSWCRLAVRKFPDHYWSSSPWAVAW